MEINIKSSLYAVCLMTSTLPSISCSHLPQESAKNQTSNTVHQTETQVQVEKQEQGLEFCSDVIIKF